MSKHDLALARNEIYARHGRKFQTEEYANISAVSLGIQLIRIIITVMMTVILIR